MKLKNIEEIHRKNNTGSRDVIMQCSRFYVLFLSNSFNNVFLRLRFFEYKKFLVQNFFIEELSVGLIAKFSVKMYISYGNCTSSILLGFFIIITILID